MDFTSYINFAKRQNEYSHTIMEVSILLDKETICDALKFETIYICPHYYEVPYDKLVNILACRNFGEHRITLKRIEDEKK